MDLLQECLNAMQELDVIKAGFQKNFRKYKGKKIILFRGEYLEEIVSCFGSEYNFCKIADSAEDLYDTDADLLILTDHRRWNEPDYQQVCEYCKNNEMPVYDLFGLEQTELHKEFDAQQYLSIAEWKMLLKDYDVVIFPIPYVVIQEDVLLGRWYVKQRTKILYDWIKENNKTVTLVWRKKFGYENQIQPLIEAGINFEGTLFERTGKDLGYLTIKNAYPDKKIINLGFELISDGIIPREYGIDSYLIRPYELKSSTYIEKNEEEVILDKESVKNEILQHEIISFDIFDTLIYRMILRPEDVFLMVEKKTGVSGYAELRESVQNNHPYAQFDELYQLLQKEAGYSDGEISLLKETELSTEVQILKPRTAIIDLMNYALSLDKTVILTSDMYLPEKYLKDILEDKGITGYSRMFVSCEEGMFKTNGLFREIKNRYPLKKILHLGNDHNADYLAPLNEEIDAVTIPGCIDHAGKNGWKAVIDMCGNLSERNMTGFIISSIFADPFDFVEDNDLRISVCGMFPIIAGYLSWIIKVFENIKYDKMLFPARDGYLLLNPYRQLQKKYKYLPDCVYLYMNRHSAFLPLSGKVERVRYILDIPYHKFDMDFMKIVYGLEADELSVYENEDPVQYLAKNEAVLIKNADKQYRNTLLYLENLDLDKNKKYAMMDFIAAGTTQMMLQEFSEYDIHGYYVALPEYSNYYRKNIDYYLDDKVQMDFESLLKIECFFSSPEPSLNCFDESGKPVFFDEHRDSKLLKKIRSVEATTEFLLKDYIDHLFYGEKISPEIVVGIIGKLKISDMEKNTYDDWLQSQITV